MNSPPTSSPPPRVFREWTACFGAALVLAALVFWSSAGGGRVWLAWGASGVLVALGIWLEGRSEALRDFGRIILAGGLGTLYGVTFAAHHHGFVALVRSPWFAWLALAGIAGVITRCAERRSSTKVAEVGLALAGFGAALQPFALFYLASGIVLAAVGAWLLNRHGWIMAAWVTLAVVYLGFLIWWPYSDGRVDPDRYLELHEYRATLGAFAIVWALFAWSSLRAAFESGRRLGFVTLNNALFYGLGVLIVPPGHPEWYWKFTLGFGLLLLATSALAGRFPEVRRSYLVQGGLLVVLGLVSALTGRELAAMLAVGSVFCVLTATDREHWLLRDLAYAAALLAVACVWTPVREHAANGLRLGALTGALLVFNACWIDPRRALWERWAVGVFSALGLGVWLLTTLYCTPEVQRAPVLALEAVLLTASFATLRVWEIPWLGKSFLLGALIVWFMQLGAFVRPWWHPVVVVFATLGVSFWWQKRGRTLIPAWEVHWVQGVAAAASMAILLLWLDGRFGAQPPALVIMGVLALVLLLVAVAMGDWLLAAFSQIFTITAVGEFIGQHGTAPLPGPLAALAPIVALPLMASIVRAHFTHTEWERPASWVATLYGMLAAAMFAVWTLHYVGPANRFLVLAVAAMLLLLWSVVVQPRGPLLASLICSSGALLAYWLGWIGAHGFRLRDLLAFILLLGFGVIGRRTRLLPEIIQEIGIVIGLASVVHWVSLWAPHHFPAMPLAVVWTAVALIVLCLGWWLDERLYRGVAWALLAGALARTLWVDIHTPFQFRFGLLAVGAAALVAAFSYARRPAPAGK